MPGVKLKSIRVPRAGDREWLQVTRACFCSANLSQAKFLAVLTCFLDFFSLLWFQRDVKIFISWETDS